MQQLPCSLGTGCRFYSWTSSPTSQESLGPLLCKEKTDLPAKSTLHFPNILADAL